MIKIRTLKKERNVSNNKIVSFIIEGQGFLPKKKKKKNIVTCF